MIRPLLVFAAAVLGGCRSQYHVELWNDTGHAMDVRIVERGWGVTRSGRHATVATGGWFDYRIDTSDPWPQRSARLELRDVGVTADLDLTGQQVFRGRVLLAGPEITVEPISRRESDERRQRN